MTMVSVNWHDANKNTAANTTHNFNFIIYLFGLVRMMSAAITPGIHPTIVRRVTINKEPQPLSTTANGGKIIESNARQKLMVSNLRLIFCFSGRNLYPKL